MAYTSAKSLLKNACTCSFVFKELKDTSPSKGKNKVQVKVPSKFGSAINM